LSETLRTAARTVILSALDVSRGVETLETDKKNRRSFLWIGEFPQQITGFNGLRDVPRIGGILRVREWKKSDEREENSSTRASRHSESLRGRTSLVF
jgi:hypothetical protein